VMALCAEAAAVAPMPAIKSNVLMVIVRPYAA
jgi:hypothetical protein